MRYNISTIYLCIVVLSPNLYGDQITFKNGDRLTGKIANLADGKLVFKSDLAGQVTVDIKDIRTFASDSPVKVHLKDGTAFERKVAASEPDYFAIEVSGTLQAQQFRLADIALINPPPKPEPKWTGNISGGVSATRGNTTADGANGSISLVRRSEKDRIQVSADYANRRQEDPDTGISKTTEDWWRTKAKYDYFFSKKMYGYMDSRYEKDSIALLDRRVLIGGGGGYQWIESDKMKFSTEIGLASLYEKFDNQPNSNNELSAQVGYNFTRSLTETVKFIHDLTYYPSTDKFTDYYLTSTAELRANLTQHMFMNFKVIFGYDATPAPGQGSTDVKYLFGVGWDF